MTVFQLASLAWLAGGVARPLMFLTDAFGYGSAPGSSLAATTIGGALGLAIGAFLWRRPGRPSAIAGVLIGFYAVPSLLNAQLLGTPGWFVVLASLGIVAFILSAACLWQTRGAAAV